MPSSSSASSSSAAQQQKQQQRKEQSNGETKLFLKTSTKNFYIMRLKSFNVLMHTH